MNTYLTKQVTQLMISPANYKHMQLYVNLLLMPKDTKFANPLEMGITYIR